MDALPGTGLYNLTPFQHEIRLNTLINDMSELSSEIFCLFRSRYNNNRNEIVFLAISDDYNWIKVIIDTMEKAIIKATF